MPKVVNAAEPPFLSHYGHALIRRQFFPPPLLRKTLNAFERIDQNLTEKKNKK